MSRTIHAFIFAFIVGGLVGYALSTSQALTAAAAVADAVPIDAVPILDARQVEITSPTPMLSCPQAHDMANAGVPAKHTKTSTTEPPGTRATGSPIETPVEGPDATGLDEEQQPRSGNAGREIRNEASP